MLYRGFKQDMIACLGEFVGTTMFIFLGLGCIKTAQDSQTSSQLQTATTLSNQALIFIAVGMGFSLLITAWVFYRITGGLFNPAVTLALWLIGGLKTVRAILLTGAQMAGGIAGAALVAGLTPGDGIGSAITTLQPGMSYPKGVFLEAFLTAMLVFTVLMLAAEKHRATYLAPIGIGLTLFVCQMFGTLWTGCAMNPARALGPSVVSGRFPGYHWIYYVGPIVGSLIATALYGLLKAFDYTSVVLGQDSSDEQTTRSPPVSKLWHAGMGFTRQQRTAMLAGGMKPHDIERAEANMVEAHNAGQAVASPVDANGKLFAQPAQPRTSDATIVNMYPQGGANGNVQANGAASSLPSKTSKKSKTSGAHLGASTGTGGAPHPNLSSMQPMMQESGAISAPGAHSGGLTAVPIVKKVFRYPNHNAHK
ncbi:aquaporin-like protein [Cystobasidium minutum MCA 4210]|uniref:aquaporin-like protein n=1 Tax=Cystobasidium minutum MCA 4210 TaxID=1397322 RepID=UPI0034D013DD|eukprot:jgi/Rhomi1/209510/estExt_Genemark1.C_3_t10121